MSELKHTPGPWEVCVGNEGSIFGDLDNPEHNGDNPYIGTVAGIGVDKDLPECTANAMLIAAAPDMFDAIQSALNIKQLWAPSGDMPIEHEGEAHALQSMLTAFEAVIAKIN